MLKGACKLFSEYKGDDVAIAELKKAFEDKLEEDGVSDNKEAAKKEAIKYVEAVSKLGALSMDSFNCAT